MGTRGPQSAVDIWGTCEYGIYVNALIWSGRGHGRGARAVDWLRVLVTNSKGIVFFKFVAEENKANKLREKTHTEHFQASFIRFLSRFCADLSDLINRSLERKFRLRV